MRKNKQRMYLLLLSGFALFNSACAQNPPLTGKAYVKEQLSVEQATVLLNNEKQLIPLQNLDNNKIASIHFSSVNSTSFDSLLNKYTKVDAFNGNDYMSVKTLDMLVQDTKFYNMLIVQLTDAEAGNPAIIAFINNNQKMKNVVVSLLGTNSSLTKLNDVTSPIIWSTKKSQIAAFYSAQVIFGGVAITQKLTKTYSPKYATNTGYLTSKTRLQYTVPEDAGINADNLKEIDAIAQEAISNRATPGCVVLVAKDGKVIFNKAYGYHTYDNSIPDRITDIFDIASMTKISATTMEAMQLYDQGKLNLDSTLGTYLAISRNSNKKTLAVREILEHQAGLIPDISTFEMIKPADHSTDSSAAFPVKVSDNYYVSKGYFDEVMLPAALRSLVKTRGQYVYSDVGMIFMQQIEEAITAIPLNKYVQDKFYNPLGMQTAGFLPLYRFPANRIPPTEDDRKDRKTLIDGYVHDPTAALMGGVAGHAGVFAGANDVAIMYQMMLNRGTYGGVQYVKAATVDLWTSKQSAVSRRGLGFDRWDPIADRNYPSKLASDQAYGHTGFTGTCVWVDPKYGLVYVFLSNRVHPNVGNKLGSLNIRPRIQDAVYEAIQKGM
ncbi:MULTISPECIES: serine hydrolase [unclassified Mucilaginibacter]|uniref:serine hydrolase domain-containing protein n=1 Tax=unclassified Mucilaginibacter TaxID=2617802 RepID=UPI002AC92EB2|nr:MULTISPECIES: serine hydrolase [unclassified Mucilaginibacter]MEB0248535.1 serine hydrolase [Mucilaginibacter sp. 5B2]MEB0261632.1 serine hydrolase [Mucilaginibacter sp. 10I4]MEB0278497.1 serine hydrolase [Mucilaginibacter sp. 10B2]MEB0300717.1 serine hydrolase [Mucilaginibacter sp. 5C4]WPX23547.1 serine hydrolase [Mucilaginibacter sp. 5C4]